MNSWDFDGDHISVVFHMEMEVESGNNDFVEMFTDDVVEPFFGVVIYGVRYFFTIDEDLEVFIMLSFRVDF